MKLTLSEYCIRCGLCEDLYPDLFKRNYKEHRIDVLFDEIPADKKDRAKQAAEDCAVAAIRVFD